MISQDRPDLTQSHIIDSRYEVPHDHFVSKFLSALMNVLTEEGEMPEMNVKEFSSSRQHLNVKQLEFLSKKLSTYQTDQTGFVTRDSFLGSLEDPVRAEG